jgi:hypothetical protein
MLSWSAVREGALARPPTVIAHKRIIEEEEGADPGGQVFWRREQPANKECWPSPRRVANVRIRGVITIRNSYCIRCRNLVAFCVKK